ncbi:MAG TPA: hypothetical protein PKW86_09295, partial [bacterium]|nr:hypothetical protein [bacterium]
PEIFQLVYPYFSRSIETFKGFVHFCGSGSHILEYFLNCKHVRMINFGNPERFDWNETIKLIAKHGKTYYGTVNRSDGESLSEYFERVLEPLERKSNLMFVPHLRSDEEPEKTIEIWHNLQNKKFSAG